MGTELRRGGGEARSPRRTGPALRPEHAAGARCPPGAAGGELRPAERLSGWVVRRAAQRGRAVLRGRAGAGGGRRRRGRPDRDLRADVSRARPPRSRLDADVRALPARLAARGCPGERRPRGRVADLALQPEQPDRRAARAGRDRRARPGPARGCGRRRRGLLRVRRPDVHRADRRAAERDRAAHALEGVRLRVAPCGLCDRGAGGGSRAGAAARARRRQRPVGPDRGGRPEGAAARRGGDDRGARAGACRARRGGPRLPAERRQLRLRPQRRAARRAARGAGARRARLRRRHQDHRSAAARGRSPARSARCRGRRAARPVGLRRAHELGDRAARVARARRIRPRARRDGDRLPRPPAGAPRLPRRLRPRAARGRRPRGRRAPHRRGLPRSAR